MSLFPAYARDSSEIRTDYEAELCNEPQLSALEAQASALEAQAQASALEAQLLASDNDEEHEPGGAGGAVACSQPEHQDYYLDRNSDIGNMRVSTLYYPGRPQYDYLASPEALGRRGGVRGAGRARRYYSAAAPAPEPHADAELAQRTRAFRDMLAENPADEALWLRFIEFQERSRSADAALAAAGEAAARLRGSRRARAALHRARGLALPPARRLQLLRADLADLADLGGESSGEAGDTLTELWLRALDAASAAGAGAQLDAAAAAALAATRALPRAYPHVLYVYGGHLRAAGLWERLVLLLELVTSMNFPPAAAFPPRVPPERRAEQERHLQDLEDKTISSGLPLSAVWVRVERERAAAHWRAPPGGAPSEDPQRAPAPADVAELLRPAAAPAAALLLLQALRLAKVPLLPAAHYALLAADAGNDALGDARDADVGEALPALLRAARRLPAAHPARPARAAPAARLVALLVDPPHYFTDDAGYLSWVTALWDASCEWLAGEWRVALLCWRLRWLHALLLLLDTQEETGRKEARRMRGEARAALKRFAGSSPLPFAQFARVELAAGDPPAARRAALHALRAALRDRACPPHQRLYVARVVSELCVEAAPGEWATASAALELALPPDEQLAQPPPRDLLRRALQRCEEHCERLELQHAAPAPHAPPAPPAPDALLALLPAPAEWAAARAHLASPARRAALVRQARAAAPHAPHADAARYWEHSACALVVAAAREHRLAQYARAFAPLFPHNALLALACSGAPLWAWEKDGTQEERLRAMTCGARSHRGALAHALPALLRAAAGGWEPREAARAAAACARAARGGAGGALLHAARLESEARAARPRAAAALFAALDRHPHHKWLCVRGAAWCPEQAAALADVLLERQLRAHALLDELAPPPHAS